MDIGSNKPTAAEQAAVPHHLLNLREPHEPFSLAEYLAAARAKIEELIGRGITPMLTGGTGQYIRAVREGWRVPEVPPDEALRDRWLAFEREHGQKALFGELTRRDPQAAETIDARNVRRVVRALEVMEVTGQLWSELQRKEPLPYDFQMHYVNMPRERLYQRVDARILSMAANGWVDECVRLLAVFSQHGIATEQALAAPAMSALGYREMTQVALGQLALKDAIEKVKQQTRRYIRMQDTWFRKDAG